MRGITVESGPVKSDRKELRRTYYYRSERHECTCVEDSNDREFAFRSAINAGLEKDWLSETEMRGRVQYAEQSTLWAENMFAKKHGNRDSICATMPRSPFAVTVRLFKVH